MNSVVLVGRLTDDPEKRYTQGQEPMAVTKYRLAVDRFGGKEADFIGVVTFGKAAEFADDYFHKGMKVCIHGRIQTGSYTNREGKKVYTTDVVADQQEFCERKEQTEPKKEESGFMQISEDEVSELPFV